MYQKNKPKIKKTILGFSDARQDSFYSCLAYETDYMLS